MNISGNLKGLSSSELKAIERLSSRRLDADRLIELERARELYRVAEQTGRIVALLIDRAGNIVHVIVGDRQIVYLPDLGRYRFGKGRLRRLRLVYADLSKNSKPQLADDILTDLEKLRLDMVAAVKVTASNTAIQFATLKPIVDIQSVSFQKSERPVLIQNVPELSNFQLPLNDFLNSLDDELSSEQLKITSESEEGAVLIGVHSLSEHKASASMSELAELARTAGLKVKDTIIQRRTPDPKTLLGKGKLEEVVLHCLRIGASMLIFDTELRPFQWRIITNSTDLKVIDRSMLILDIFASRAQSAEGRLQVELAQLKYLLPRLTEQDSGLSRLSGGIGGRGPGETKLEIGRRRIRDRITDLEKRITKVASQRKLKRSRLESSNIPIVSIVGYTNAGKSSLFNSLTKSALLAEDKMFATLDVTRRKLSLPSKLRENDRFTFALTDTVGFIRDLPNELKNAFRATLEEVESSSLLLHLVDVSEEGYEQRISSVQTVLEEMNLSTHPTILVCNKIDKLNPTQLEKIKNEFDKAVLISAADRLGMESLLETIEEHIENIHHTAAPPDKVIPL